MRSRSDALGDLGEGTLRMGIPRWGWGAGDLAQPGSCPGQRWQQEQRCLGIGLIDLVARKVPMVGLEPSGTSLTLFAVG